jgi:hypothetical protein
MRRGPQGSLAPVRVLRSRSLLADSDPIRQSRRHPGTSRFYRVSPGPSRCGSAEATHETFPPFPGVLSPRAADRTPVGPLAPPVRWAQRYQAPSHDERVATHTPVSARNPRRGSLSRLPRSRQAAARAFARPSWLAPTGRRPACCGTVSLPLLALAVAGQCWESGEMGEREISHRRDLHPTSHDR